MVISDSREHIDNSRYVLYYTSRPKSKKETVMIKCAAAISRNRKPAEYSRL